MQTMLSSRLLVVLVATLVIVVLYCTFHSCAGKWERWRRTKVSNASKGANVCIVGAGVSGLSAAYFMRPRRATIFEKRNDVGGNNYSSRSTPRIPMRYGCSLTHRSPTLMRMTHELGLTWSPMPEGTFVKSAGGHDVLKEHTRITDVATYVLMYAQTFWMYHMSEEAMRRSAGEQLDLRSSKILDPIMSTIGGINMFADRRDVADLPADQVAAYMLHSFPGNFSFVDGGNHKIVEALDDATRCSTTRHLGHAVETIARRGDGIIVDGVPYDSVVLTPPPHVAREILDPSFALHHEVFDCFETTQAFSCVHEDHSVFEHTPAGSNLLYYFCEEHHAMHIDAAWYNLLPRRSRYVSYWYDSAPCPVASDKILERSHVTLSRSIASKRLDLWKLLMRLKSEHQNVHLSNAAYSGWMWHEDACTMSKMIAEGL